MADTNPAPHPLLGPLTSEELDELRSVAARRAFHAGDIILKEGDVNSTLYAVENGSLHAYRMAKRRRYFLGDLPPGSCFGEVSLFDPGPTTATVAAVTEGTLLVIDRQSLGRFLERQPAAGASLLIHLLTQMAQRLRRTDSRLVDSLLWGSAGAA